MAKYGARYIKWAPFASENAEPENSLPKYGTAKQLSGLVKVTDTPSYAEGKLYADDELAEYASEFTESGIDVEVNDISNELTKDIYGALGGTDGEIVMGKDDAAPYGGFGFITLKTVNGKKSYVGVFYPKCKAKPQAEEYSTKGDSITFATTKLHFVGTAAKNGAWKCISGDNDTLAEATAWLDAKFANA